jgi:hypothetical protein
VRYAELAPRLAHPLVRSLAWLIGSPVLLDAGDPRFAGRIVDDAWCEAALGRAAPWLLEVDRDPSGLEAWIATQHTRRLGRLAEALLAFWLERCGEVELLARNVPVRDAQRTLGEFDFILHETGAPMPVHWESAVKFYLQTPAANGFAGYVGPGDRDVLAAKIDKVFSRQLMLCHTPEGAETLRARDIGKVSTAAFIKGWLFYERGGASPDAPGLSAHHSRGWWLRAQPGWERALDVEARYVILPRLQWLAWPWRAQENEVLDRHALVREISACVNAEAGAQMVLEVAPADGAWREVSRGFVAPAGWGQPAGQPAAG